jgi:hypothetical protein
MDFGFKFNIGDRLTVSECARQAELANAELKPDSYARVSKPLLIVRSRLLEECYGGIQRHYDCRVIARPSRTVGSMEVSFSGSQVGGLFRLSEPELERFDEAQSVTT